MLAVVLILHLKVLHADSRVRIDGTRDESIASDYSILTDDRLASEDRSIGLYRNVIADGRMTLLA